MTQTTLSVDDTSDVIDALRQRFPKIVGPRKDDICYATTNRQEAVRALAEQAEVVLVVGSKNSRTPTVWRSWPSVWGNPLT
jgi:4-hydroxy-3-methylbut-2-enyl diphosphate reductase